MAKATGYYRYDPATGSAYLLTDTGNANPLDPAVLLFGTLELRGYQLFNIGESRILDQLGQTGDINIVTYDNGKTLITSEIVRGTITSGGPRAAVYTLSGDVLITMPDGSLQTVTIERAGISGANEQVYRFEDAEGVEHFEALIPDSLQFQALADRFTASFRLATAGEAEERAIKGYLLRNEEALIQSYRQQMIDAGADPGDATFSAALEQLYQSTGTSIQYGKETYVDAAGNAFALGQA